MKILIHKNSVNSFQIAMLLGDGMLSLGYHLISLSPSGINIDYNPKFNTQSFYSNTSYSNIEKLKVPNFDINQLKTHIPKNFISSFHWKSHINVISFYGGGNIVYLYYKNLGYIKCSRLTISQLIQKLQYITPIKEKNIHLYSERKTAFI